jgi:hypothetical protein
MDEDFKYFPTKCSFNDFSKDALIKINGKEVSFNSYFTAYCKGKESCDLKLPAKLFP